MRPEGLDQAGERTTFSLALGRTMQPTAATVWDPRRGAQNTQGTTHLGRAPELQRRSASLQSAPLRGILHEFKVPRMQTKP